jgi:hypothetical protein
MKEVANENNESFQSYYSQNLDVIKQTSFSS